MRINYSPQAQQELLKIIRYYDDGLPGLGVEFKLELDRQMNLCCESPEIGMRVGKQHRRLVMSRFPFNIIYQIREQEIRVIAVAHQHRKPGYWKRRMQFDSNNKINEPVLFWPATLPTAQAVANKSVPLSDMTRYK